MSVGQKKLLILLCTYQGQRFLAQQLDSIEAQSYPAWSVCVSDDGSSDETITILRHYQQRWGQARLQVVHGPRAGFAANFRHACRQADVSCWAFAFSDQDDIWDPGKLDRAVVWLDQQPRELPSLYCARTRLIDEGGVPLGMSPRFDQPTEFANALVESIGGGNTMVFNAAALQAINSLSPDIAVALHDWWAYQIVSGIGGRVHFDPQACLSYRQHGGNLVGVRDDWLAPLAKLTRLADSSWIDKVDIHLRALQSVRHRLTVSNQRTLDMFQAGRRAWLLPRLRCLWRSGVRRQRRADQAGLWLAALLGRI